MPVPVDPAPSDPWATTPAGIVIITLACCLSVAVAALVAALMCTRRARRSGRVAQPSIELDLAEIKVRPVSLTTERRRAAACSGPQWYDPSNTMQHALCRAVHSWPPGGAGPKP